MQENKKRRNPFLFAPVLLLPTIVLLGSVSLIFSEPFKSLAFYLIAGVIFFLAFGVPITMFFCLRGKKWLSASLLPIGFRGIVLSFSAAFLMMSQSVVCRTLLMEGFFDHRIYTMYGLSFEVGVDSAEKIFTAILVLALIPAIMEGILFRGIFMYEYRFGGVILSVLFSSVLCAMTGVTFSDSLLYLMNALVLSVTAFVTGNFISSVLAHFIFLVYSLFWEKYLLFLGLEIETQMVLFFLLLGVWITAAMIFCDNAERILRKRGERENPRPPRFTLKQSFLVFFDIISAPLLWADVLIFAVFAVLHLFF